MLRPRRRLRDWLSRIGNDNAQGEYYLTDIVELAVADGVPVFAERADSAAEVAGINDRSQLATAEASVRARRAAALMRQGVRWRTRRGSISAARWSAAGTCLSMSAWCSKAT